jgi:hypothetical protein
LESEQNHHIKFNIITALGKLGHIKSVQPLAKIISNKQYEPLIRSMAVYNLKRVARLEPVHIKHILLFLIDNPAEDAEVRIAAVAILPFAQPTTTEWQKIAVRSWFEPSKQVASFIYSTFRSLVRTEVPELKSAGQMVKPLISLVKPFEYGYQYAKNINSDNFVEYLGIAISQKSSWTKTNLVPSRLSWITKVFSPSSEITLPSFTLYTQGMEKWIDQIMYYTNQISGASQKVTEELSQITRKLNIQERLSNNPESFLQVEIMNMESEYYLNEAKVVEILEELSEQLRLNSQYLNEEKQVEYIRAFKAFEVETLGPCDAGFPIYIERSMPVVFAIKATGQLVKESNQPIPTMIKAKIMPVVNIKLEANMGVISPFTHELIGSGLDMAMHMTLPLEMTLSRQGTQVTMTVKTPEEIQRQIEAIHIYIKPFTVKKNLRKIEPVSKSTNLKTILSGEPLKEVKRNIGEPLELDAQFISESDNKYVDLYSYWQKIRQHNFVSLYNTLFLTSSLRMSSTKILFNPQLSKTKELSLSFSLCKFDFIYILIKNVLIIKNIQ